MVVHRRWGAKVQREDGSEWLWSAMGRGGMGVVLALVGVTWWREGSRRLREMMQLKGEKRRKIIKKVRVWLGF